MSNENNLPTDKATMKTLVSVMNHLEKSGFQTQFKATDQGLLSLTTNKAYQPHEINVVHFYRFEGESNPDDSSILYAIEAKNSEKGTLVNGYGAYASSKVTHFMQQVEGKHK